MYLYYSSLRKHIRKAHKEEARETANETGSKKKNKIKQGKYSCHNKLIVTIKKRSLQTPGGENSETSFEDPA